MTKIQNTKQYDLEKRTYGFARRVRDYVNDLPKKISNTRFESNVKILQPQ